MKKELAEVSFLRGLASVLVCLFHLILGNAALFPSTNLLERIFSVGYMGVEVFFILSGYIICYSLPPGFNFGDVKTFILKRIIRIEPPYIVSVILIIILNSLSHTFTGLPDKIDWLVVISHLAYINNFYPGSYLNVVYWTLGIEFQFYFLIALLFPLIKTSQFGIIAAVAVFIGIACWRIPYKIDIIVPYLSYFALGILLLFYKRRKKMNAGWYFALSVFSCLQIFLFQGWGCCIAAISTVLVLHFWTYSNKLIRFFSTISYSLYLIHVPVGGKVINLGMRYAVSDSAKYALVLLALLISVAFAYVFYRCVERPAISFSKRFTYRFQLANSTQKTEEERIMTAAR